MVRKDLCRKGYGIQYNRNNRTSRKVYVPGTGQVADAEKRYNQESTTWDFLVHSLIMQQTVAQELPNPQPLYSYLMPSHVFFL